MNTLTIENVIASVNVKIERKYGNPLGSGLTRNVYESKNFVIKVPRNVEGIYCNYHEASLGAREFKKNPQNAIYATCRIKHIDGIPVLVMEKVEPKNHSKNMPDWVDFIDCQQVGYTKDGRLVAYDFG